MPERILHLADAVIWPMAVITVTTLGGWGLWASVGVYDSNRHIESAKEVTEDLKAITLRLEAVEKSFIAIQATSEANHEANNRLLAEILRQLSL